MPRPPGLRIEGARQNNLKNVSLEIPHDRLTVVTGVSGSGKSSLAFDTLFAEGQWRYIESLSTYARMFLDRVDRPDVDRIENIRPAVALEQKNPVRTARSTVGTATEVYDYLRLLYAKIGRVHCPSCGAAAVSHSPDSIADALLSEHAGARALVTFPLPVPAGQPAAELWAGLTRRGFARVLVDGVQCDLAVAAAGAGGGHDRGGARSPRARSRASQPPGGIAGERAARGRRSGRDRAGRRRAARLRRGVSLQRVRHRARAAAAAALLVQPSARRLQRVQGLRQHPQVRRGARGARPHAQPQRRRGRAVDASLGQVVPARAAEGGQARGPRSDEAVGRARRAGARLRVRGRGQVSRHQRLLRGDRVVPLQAARAGLPLPLSQPVALPGVPGRAAQAAGPRRARRRIDDRRVRHPDHRPGRRPRGRSQADRVGSGRRPRDPAPAAGQAHVPAAGRSRLPHPGAPDALAVGRRGPAHQSGQPARLPAGRHALRARRAVHRPARARHDAAGRSLPRAGPGRQHGRRRRARPQLHRGRRSRGRAGAGLGRARRRDRRGRPAGGVPPRRPLVDRAVRLRPREHSRPARAAAGPASPDAERRARAQPQGRHAPGAAGHADRRHRRVRIGQVDAGPRHALPGGRARVQGRVPAAGRVRRAHRSRIPQGRAAHRPGADRPHAALQSGHLREGVRRDPQALRRPAPRQDAGAQRRRVLVQRAGRALRVVPGRRLPEARDVLLRGCLRLLPGVRGTPLPSRGARCEATAAGRSAKF